MSQIDDLMGFDPTQLDVFNETNETFSYDENIYKANPKNSKSDSGSYFSKVRILYNPFNVRKSIQHQATYWMEDADGGFLVKSKLGDGDKSCPIFVAWKKLWFSGDESKKQWSRDMFQKTESNWVLVQILEDDNQPEMVGKFKLMKLAQAIYDKLDAKMNPKPETKKTPVSVMDYLTGPILEMNVQPGPDDPKNPSRKQREISYTLCDFSEDYAPIISVDGTPFFTDEELEIIDNYVEARKKLVKARTEASKVAAQQEIDDLMDDIKALYGKALDYVKTNAPDLQKECGYREWDERTATRVQNWINLVLDMKDPKVESAEDNPIVAAGAKILAKKSEPVEEKPVDPFLAVADGADSDLPF